MKNRIINNLLIALGTSCMLASCMDKDYDFDKIDYTLGFGGETLKLPSKNSTADILLEDLLDIEGSELITTAENGDYMFGKDPTPVEPEAVTVDPITMKGRSVSPDAVVIPVPLGAQGMAGETINLSDFGLDMEANGRIAAFDYSFRVPASVRSLDYVGIGENGNGADFNVWITLPPAIKRFETLTIDLPDNLEMTCRTALLDAGNVVSLPDFINEGNLLLLSFNITGIKAEYLSSEDYAMLLNGEFLLKGSVGLSAKVAELEVPFGSQVRIGGQLDVSDISITSARGIFNPDINLTTAGTVNINDIPDFLTDEAVVADLDNPQIWLTLHSTVPLGGILKVLLRSDTYPTGITFDTPGRYIELKPSTDGTTETDTKVLFCRRNPGVSTTEYQVIEDEDLSKLVTTLREGMKVEFLVTEARVKQETGTVLLGHEYRIAPEYRFEAPLALGPKAVIVYNKNFDGWNKDLKNLTLVQEAYVHMQGTAYSMIPADLEAEATPIDAYGQPLNEVSVELIQKTVKGTASGTATSPVELKIRDLTGDGLRKLDGIALKLKAASNEQLRGVTLNKSKQTLTLKDISIELSGKVVYDAN